VARLTSGMDPMVYRGVEYEISPTTPGVWEWHFQIGDRIKAGKTKSNLELLANRRVQLVIDRELRAGGANVQRAAE
jgi:hypothetical protein